MKFSEVGQDIFALEVSKNKTYIEVGSAHPIKFNNTYLLEKNGWIGFGIEYDQTYKEDWVDSSRTNKIYFYDALTFDYITAIAENNLKSRIGYLSIDINPPTKTLEALEKIINLGITFDCITFEHDKYRIDQENYVDIEEIAKNFLLQQGYKIAVDNVYTIRRRRQIVDGIPSREKYLTKCHFETWYVNKDIEYKTLDYTEWIANYTNQFN